MMTTTTTCLEALRARIGAELDACMPAHLERPRWPADRLACHQRDKLRELLRHAIERSPFHTRRLGPIADPDHFELTDLATLPTMSKSDMMAALEAATQDVRKKNGRDGKYEKSDAFELVGKIDPKKVRVACPGFAERFFKAVETS